EDGSRGIVVALPHPLAKPRTSPHNPANHFPPNPENQPSQTKPGKTASFSSPKWQFSVHTSTQCLSNEAMLRNKKGTRRRIGHAENDGNSSDSRAKGASECIEKTRSGAVSARLATAI